MTQGAPRSVHVGIVSLGYPPLKHVAALRAGRFAEELVSMGARVTVYTSAVGAGDSPTLGSDRNAPSREDVRVIRAPSDFMTSSAAPSHGNAVARRALTARRMFGDGAHGAWVRRVLKSIDSTDGPADRPDVLWAIHGSDSAHALARRLARRFDIPWVADYKDNWDLGKTGIARAAAYVAHRRRTSSAIAFTAASRIGARHLGDVFGRDAVAIYTGVDASAWRDGAAADLGEGFNIVFTGHATSPAMGVDVVRQGLVQALKARPEDVVNVHYFGHEGGWLRDCLHAAGFGKRFVDHGFEPQDVIIRAQKGADLLLYLPYIRTPLICVKFFEYVASGRPILSVPAERDAREDVDGLHVARTADDVAATLVALVSQWHHAGRLPSFARDVSEYEWRPQSEALLSVLTGAARANSFPSALASLC